MSYKIYKDTILKIDKKTWDLTADAGGTLNNWRQTTGTTYTDVNGSIVTHTPHELATKVVYEFEWAHDPRENNGIYFMELYETTDGGSSWNSMGNNYRFTYYENDDVKLMHHNKIRFVLPIYTGTRSYKLLVRASSNSSEQYLHDQPSQGDFNPSAFIFSVL